jgi:hypothetical protein
MTTLPTEAFKNWQVKAYEQYAIRSCFRLKFAIMEQLPSVFSSQSDLDFTAEIQQHPVKLSVYEWMLAL